MNKLCSKNCETQLKLYGETMWKQWQTLFSWGPEWLWVVTAAMELKDICPLEEKLWET